jgi:hypothetical protein
MGKDQVRDGVALAMAHNHQAIDCAMESAMLRALIILTPFENKP